MENLGCGCPGSMARVIEREETTTEVTGTIQSELRQWPVQLHLVPPTAPYFQNADILVAADCVAFAMGDMHHQLLKGKALAIACPKLDDTGNMWRNWRRSSQQGEVKSITVAIMEVPCCRGLDVMVREAVARSGRDIPLETLIIGIDGERRYGQ